MIPISWMLTLSAVVFVIGVVGVLVRRNALIIFMSIELMLNAANLAFVAFARELGSLDGQIFVFFVMTVAAAEAAVGLGIIIAFFRHRQTVNADELRLLAKLPSREQLLIQLAHALHGPIQGLAMVLQGNIRNLVVVLHKINEQKPKG